MALPGGGGRNKGDGVGTAAERSPNCGTTTADGRSRRWRPWPAPAASRRSIARRPASGLLPRNASPHSGGCPADAIGGDAIRRVHDRRRRRAASARNGYCDHGRRAVPSRLARHDLRSRFGRRARGDRGHSRFRPALRGGAGGAAPARRSPTASRRWRRSAIPPAAKPSIGRWSSASSRRRASPARRWRRLQATGSRATVAGSSPRWRACLVCARRKRANSPGARSRTASSICPRSKASPTSSTPRPRRSGARR